MSSKSLIETEPFQKNKMSDELRNMIWNTIYMALKDNLNSDGGGYDYPKWSNKLKPWVKDIWSTHFNLPLDTIDNDPNNYIDQIKVCFFSLNPDKVYEFTEFFCKKLQSKKFENNCNNIFQQQRSAYKFVNCCIIENISEVETDSLNSSLNTSYREVNEHMSKALTFLSDKRRPDFHNSIKEAVSAIEALARIITETPNGTLGQLVQNSNLNLHTCIQEAIKKVYGFASDEGGIRHSQKVNSKSICYDEALFIVVFSSSLINFVISVARAKK